MKADRKWWNDGAYERECASYVRYIDDWLDVHVRGGIPCAFTDIPESSVLNKIAVFAILATCLGCQLPLVELEGAQ